MKKCMKGINQQKLSDMKNISEKMRVIYNSELPHKIQPIQGKGYLFIVNDKQFSTLTFNDGVEWLYYIAMQYNQSKSNKSNKFNN